MFRSKMIYLDTAATTPLDTRVWSAMKPYLRRHFANPASLHRLGLEAATALESARQSVADYLKAHRDEVFFTSGGTESLNWALFGLTRQFSTPRHLVVSALEHEAVLAPCRYLEKQGWRVTIVNPNQEGIISAAAVAAALSPDTVLVAVTAANNEIGTIQPLHDIAKIIRQARVQNQSNYPYFLADACQAPRALDLAVPHLGVDLLVLNGSKIYGPKGVGALFIRREVLIEPLLFGGGQEKGLRSGTANVPGIIGLAAALKICQKERGSETKKLSALRNYLIEELKRLIPDLVINGSLTERLPSNLNVSIPGLLGEQLVIELSAKGVTASAGSACSALADKGSSTTLQALGLGADLSDSALRFSLGRETSRADLKYTAQTLAAIVAKYRKNDLHLGLVP